MNKETIDSAEPSYYYGWCKFRPSCLQGLNKGIWVLVFLTAANTVLSGTYNGLSGAVQSSIETRFQLTSTQSSWIMTSFDVASAFAGLLFAYVGSKPQCHRPRVITIGLLIALFACLLYALPHFTTSVYEPTSNITEGDNLCRNRSIEDMCSEDDNDGISDASIQNYLAVFIISRILLSFGAAPITLLGLTWLDDCVTKEVYSFYSGIFVCGWIGGPALGFVFGGIFLSIFTDFTSVVEVDIDANDPRWVGAWWLGFILAAAVLGLCTVPLSGYPNDIPDGAKIRSNKKTEAYKSGNESAGNKMDFTAKELISYLQYLFTNWTFVFLVLFVTCDIAIMAGFTVFGPKFVEVQFNLTAGQASILFGILVVPAAFIGSLSGGAIIRVLRLTLTDILKLSTGLATAILVGVVLVLLNCPDTAFAGVNQHYPDYSYDSYDQFNITHSCNSGCWCDDIVFTPVCYQDKLQFFSPCHAGCSYKSGDIYFNCSCLGNSTDTTVTNGVCPSNSCDDLIYFSIILFILMIILFMNSALNMTSIIRSVPPSHRVIAFVINNIIEKLLGAVPAPVIFGVAFDASCQLSAETCDLEQGACYYYDKRKLGTGLLITCLVYKLLSIIFVTLSWKLYKPPKDTNSEVIEQGVEKQGYQPTTSITNGDCFHSNITEVTKF